MRIDIDKLTEAELIDLNNRVVERLRFFDADLSILGAQPARFQEYEAQVRSEYAWVADAIFRPTRAKILREFLGRPRLYGTVHFQERYEAQARRNLQNSLGYLGGLGASGV